MIRRNMFFENDTVGSVIPDLDYPTSYSYTIMPDHDTRFDDTIPTDIFGGNQPGIIPTLKQEAQRFNMLNDLKLLIENVEHGNNSIDINQISIIESSLGTDFCNNMTKRFMILSEAERVVLEDIQSDIKNVKSTYEAERILERLAKSQPSMFFKVLSALSYLFGVCGGYGIGWGLLGNLVLTSAAQTTLGTVATATGVSGGVWLSVVGAFKLILSIIGVSFFAVGVGYGVKWLFHKACQKFFDIRFETPKQRQENYKLFIKILDEQILAAKKVKNTSKAEEMEDIKQRALKKLNKKTDDD